MPFGRAFKVLGLIGGGILAMGGGAVGTHLSYPFLEKNLFPNRINDEKKLKESVVYTEDQVRRLGIELNSKRKINSAQEKEIKSLSSDLNDLKEQISDKDQKLIEKGRQITEKQAQIIEKDSENQRQKDQINDLNNNLQQKEREITEVKQKTQSAQTSLDDIKTKLAIRKEDILQKSALDLNTLRIETRKIEPKRIEGELSVFETDDGKGGKQEFKVKKPSKFADIEGKLKEIQKRGMTFQIHESFNSWDKTIETNIYTADYLYKTNDVSHKKTFVKDNKSQKTVFKITDYFKEPYLTDAFRVLIALWQIENLPLCRDLSGSKDILIEFCSDMSPSIDFYSTLKTYLSEFEAQETEKKKVSFWFHTFKTNDDFVRYWIKQTVLFVRTGKVDFLDILNPVLTEKNYNNN